MNLEKNNYKIICGDALKILPEIPADTIASIITDPPYNSGGSYAGQVVKETVEKYTSKKICKLPSFVGDNMQAHAFVGWMYEWLSESFRITKPGGIIAVFTDWRQLPVVSDVIQWAGFIWQGVVVWDKKNAMPLWGKFQQSAEFIVWGSKGGMSQGRIPGYRPGVYTYAGVASAKRRHQVEKPLKLLRDVVKITEQGGIYT